MSDLLASLSQDGGGWSKEGVAEKQQQQPINFKIIVLVHQNTHMYSTCSWTLTKSRACKFNTL